MKKIFAILYILPLLSVIPALAHKAKPLPPVYLTGPTNVTAGGAIQTYTFNNSTVVMGGWFDIVPSGKGTIVSTSQSGTQYFANIYITQIFNW